MQKIALPEENPYIGKKALRKYGDSCRSLVRYEIRDRMEAVIFISLKNGRFTVKQAELT